jgi:hypothetical protein
VAKETREIGKVTFEVSPEALSEIIATGRLAEFASKVAAHAAFQVNAQVVDLVAKAALGQGVAKGISGGFSTVFEGGDFGTTGGFHGPHPHVGIAIGGSNTLSQVVSVNE